MRILIQDYSTFLTTEPKYLNGCFANSKMIETALWDINRHSAFDIMDLVKPDVIICSHTCPSIGALIRSISSSSFKTDMIVNITGITLDHLKILDSLLDYNKISTPFYIDNGIGDNQIVEQKRKILNLMPAADLFIPVALIPNFNLKAGIITTSDLNSVNEYAKKYETYHKILISNEGTNIDGFDISLTISDIPSFCKNYETVIIADSFTNTFTQLFFDCVLRSKRVIVGNTDDKVTTFLSELFGKIPENEDVAQAIKTHIANKHTCYNRAARLSRALKLEEISNVLEKVVIK